MAFRTFLQVGIEEQVNQKARFLQFRQARI
jgi:hypothetical protein